MWFEGLYPPAISNTFYLQERTDCLDAREVLVSEGNCPPSRIQKYITPFIYLEEIRGRVNRKEKHSTYLKFAYFTRKVYTNPYLHPFLFIAGIWAVNKKMCSRRNNLSSIHQRIKVGGELHTWRVNGGICRLTPNGDFQSGMTGISLIQNCNVF